MKKYLIPIIILLLVGVSFAFTSARKSPVIPFNTTEAIKEKYEVIDASKDTVTPTPVEEQQETIPTKDELNPPVEETVTETPISPGGVTLTDPQDGAVFFDGQWERWNSEKQCYDTSNFNQFEEVPYVGNGSYDPNWLVGMEMADGCMFYMHPNQGEDNQYDERN